MVTSVAQAPAAMAATGPAMVTPARSVTVLEKVCGWVHVCGIFTAASVPLDAGKLGVYPPAEMGAELSPLYRWAASPPSMNQCPFGVPERSVPDTLKDWSLTTLVPFCAVTS